MARARQLVEEAREAEATTRAIFLGIAQFPDGFGPTVLGTPLHLTVQPVGWWRQQVAAAGIRTFSAAVEKSPDGTPLWFFLLGRPAKTAPAPLPT